MGMNPTVTTTTTTMMVVLDLAVAQFLNEGMMGMNLMILLLLLLLLMMMMMIMVMTTNGFRSGSSLLWCWRNIGLK